MDTPSLHTLYLLMGSNLGDRQANLAFGRNELAREAGTIIGLSSVYETEPWGFSHPVPFYNQALRMTSPHDAPGLLGLINAIEKRAGRIRNSEGYGPRELDIDILFFDEEVLSLPDLQVPHPRLHLRRFMLAPMVELVPSLIHPILGFSMTELLEKCHDGCWVKVVGDGCLG